MHIAQIPCLEFIDFMHVYFAIVLEVRVLFNVISQETVFQL